MGNHRAAFSFLDCSDAAAALLVKQSKPHCKIGNAAALFSTDRQTALRQWKSNYRSNKLLRLRFASDDELLLLIDRSIKEKLSPKDIKQAITNWQADYMRV